MGERVLKAILSMDQITIAAWNGGAIGGGVAGLAVAGQMAAAQLLTQILEALHQIAAIQAKAGPVFGDSQALAGTIKVGVQQPQHCRINAFRRNGQATGASAVFYLA